MRLTRLSNVREWAHRPRMVRVLLDRADDHETFASSLRTLGVYAGSPIKASRRAAAYCTNSIRSTTTEGKVEQLKRLLDAAGSAVGIPPLPASPSPQRRRGRRLVGFHSPAKLKPVASMPKLKPLATGGGSGGGSSNSSNGTIKSSGSSSSDLGGGSTQELPWWGSGKTSSTTVPSLRRNQSAPSVGRRMKQPPPLLGRTRPASASAPTVLGAAAADASVGGTDGSVLGGRRAIICTLSSHTKREVLLLFDAFAMMINSKPQHAPPPAPAASEAAATGPSAAVRAASVLSGFTGKLKPTKRSFEAILRLYYPQQTADEREAMLALTKPHLEALANGRWAAHAKAQYGADIKRAFAKADKDGSGGIDVSEFAVAVEAAHIDESHVRTLFEAADAKCAPHAAAAMCPDTPLSSMRAGVVCKACEAPLPT